MSKNRIITILAIFLLLGAIPFVMGSTQSGSTQNESIQSTIDTTPAQVKNAILPQDARYDNVTVCGTFQSYDGRSYACVGLNDPVNGHYKTFVQISPRATTEAINMFTFLNSAYWEQKPVRNVDIYGGYIISVIQYDESASA
jgi:hypothetical protein